VLYKRAINTKCNGNTAGASGSEGIFSRPWQKIYVLCGKARLDWGVEGGGAVLQLQTPAQKSSVPFFAVGAQTVLPRA
jgi:hypothetical protein